MGERINWWWDTNWQYNDVLSLIWNLNNIVLQKKGQLNFIISKEFIGKATILFFFLPNSNILQYFFHLDADNEANVCFFFFYPEWRIRRNSAFGWVDCEFALLHRITLTCIIMCLSLFLFKALSKQWLGTNRAKLRQELHL